MLNTQNYFVDEQLISKGTLDKTLIHPREIFRCAIKNAASIKRNIKSELFRLTPSETGITASTDSEVENYALRYTFAPIWKYQVPVGQEFIVLPTNVFGCYIEDDEAGAAEWRDEQQVRIECWDSGLKRMVIAYAGRYVESKDMQDKDKMAKLDLLDQPLHLKSGDWIYICGYSPSTIYTIDVSDSFFSMEINRVRQALFA